jgi:hypothetical protein
MAGFSDYWENKILDHIFGKANYYPPTIYVALSTAEPLDDASGLAEPAGGAYARVQTSASDWNAASSGSLDNASDIIFPQAAGNWGTITHFALLDAATGGNMLLYGTLSQPQTINGGNAIKLTAGDLHINLD